MNRYNRHIILSEIGLEGQYKLNNAKVLVIGAGGLGCPVLQYLAAAGIGTLGIIDLILYQSLTYKDKYYLASLHLELTKRSLQKNV